MSDRGAQGARHSSCFERRFDVAVLGAGFAGWAAAREARARGLDVLLVDWGGDLLWEAGRAFAQDLGDPRSAGLRGLAGELAAIDALQDGFLDGCLAELYANEAVLRGMPELLSYVAPVAVDVDGAGHLRRVAVATKSGLRALSASRWVDATEAGTLVRLLAARVDAPAPADSRVWIYLQRRSWGESAPHALSVPGLPGDALVTRTRWPNQIAVRLDLPGDGRAFRMHLVPALAALRNSFGAEASDAFVSHVSVVPYPVYRGFAGAVPLLPANVAQAVPSLAPHPVETLDDRYALGATAAERVLAGPPAARGGDDASLPTPILASETRAEVAVIGAGTGGAIAAIAAGREGARTVVIDPLPFAGGIGTGGGIHHYYWGFPGGLQDEVDSRVLAINELFAPPGTYGGFHPEAKKLVLHAMMDAAGVEFRGGAFAYGATVAAARVLRVDVASTGGPYALRADTWIDATGDGNLAAFAGATFRFGRVGDGMLHAYSQSCSYTTEADDRLQKPSVNFDAGYVDPTDSEDMTRARVAGIHQYFVLPFAAARRPNAMSPLLGLRQGRQIDTDYVLTLDDLIERRRFPDSVGLTGSAYDNHAVDYEFESVDTMFLVWGCQLYYISTSCEIPYRMLLPRGLDNVWLGSRSLGVTEEAHHSMRMERDIQRVGEASGIAAAMAARLGCGSRAVPYAGLRGALERTGAFAVKERPGRLFGNEMGAPDLAVAMSGPPTDERLEQCLADLVSGRGAVAAFKNYGTNVERPEVGVALWLIYRYGRDRLAARIAGLVAAPDADLAWRAALLLAAWGDPAAEPRLVAAIEEREEGAEFRATVGDVKKSYNIKQVPRWWVAASFAGLCGGAGTLRALDGLARAADLPLNARTVIALSCERIVARLGVLDSADRVMVESIIGRILGSPAPLAVTVPNRNPFTGTEDFRKQETNRRVANRVEEDYSWQAVYTASRVARALGLELPEQAWRFAQDRRALVRKAFARLVAETGAGDTGQ